MHVTSGAIQKLAFIFALIESRCKAATYITIANWDTFTIYAESIYKRNPAKQSKLFCVFLIQLNVDNSLITKAQHWSDNIKVIILKANFYMKSMFTESLSVLIC